MSRLGELLLGPLFISFTERNQDYKIKALFTGVTGFSVTAQYRRPNHWRFICTN